MRHLDCRRCRSFSTLQDRPVVKASRSYSSRALEYRNSCVSRLAAVSLTIAVTGCLSPATPQQRATASPPMRPEVFFLGKTEGRGELTRRGLSPRSLRVESEGRQEPDGSFRLDQTVTYGDGEIQQRTWRMRALDERTYTGTLSDASGEMEGEVDGNVFHLRYRLRQPAVYMEQWLYLQSDRRTVVNLSEVTVLGIAVARLTERIVRGEAN